MKRIFLLTFILGAMFLLVSCTDAYRNRQNAEKLKIGMTKDEVVAIMGEPIKDERYCKPDVFFYYADPQWSDGNMTSDECMPLVFEKDKLVGMGKDFYKFYRQKDWK